MLPFAASICRNVIWLLKVCSAGVPCTLSMQSGSQIPEMTKPREGFLPVPRLLLLGECITNYFRFQPPRNGTASRSSKALKSRKWGWLVSCKQPRGVVATHMEAHHQQEAPSLCSAHARRGSTRCAGVGQLSPASMHAVHLQDWLEASSPHICMQVPTPVPTRQHRVVAWPLTRRLVRQQLRRTQDRAHHPQPRPTQAPTRRREAHRQLQLLTPTRASSNHMVRGNCAW